MVPACRQAGSGSLLISLKIMIYYVYAIRSLKNNYIYVGMSTNIQRRLYEHNIGNVFSTKGYTPWKLFYSEKCGDDRNKARNREKYLKSGVGKEFLKTMLIIPE